MHLLFEENINPEPAFYLFCQLHSFQETRNDGFPV